MKKNKFISAVILTISLFLMIGSAEADLLDVGWVSGSDFFPFFDVRTIYDDAQDLVWADFTTNTRGNWYDASNWADEISAHYSWDQDPLDFLGGWRLPTVDEFFYLWSMGLKNSSGLFFGLDLQKDYWTSSYGSLFSMASGKSNWAEPSLSFGYGMAVRDVVKNSQVPEPSSLALLALGFLGLLGFIRHREISGRG